MYKIIKERQNLKAVRFPFVKGTTIKRIHEEEENLYTLLVFNNDGLLSKEISYNKDKKVCEKEYMYENDMLIRIIKDDGNIKRFKDLSYVNGDILCVECETYSVTDGDFKLLKRTKRLEKDGNTIFYQEMRDNIINNTQSFNYDHKGRMIFKTDNNASMRFIYGDEFTMFPNKVIVNNSEIIELNPMSTRTIKLVTVNLPKFDKPRFFVVDKNDNKICSIDFLFRDEPIFVNNKLVYNPNPDEKFSARILKNATNVTIEDNRVVKMEDYKYEY